MKIYKFEITRQAKGKKITTDEIEVDEKPLTFITKSGRRISKGDIGKASGYYQSTCFLLENDLDSAANILIEVLVVKREKLQKDIKSIQEDIDFIMMNLSK